MKHTKEWKVYKDSRNIRYIVTNGKGGIGDQDCKASYIDNDENARLIAAAPELLEACKAMIELKMPYYMAVDLAYKAINKAEGKV